MKANACFEQPVDRQSAPNGRRPDASAVPSAVLGAGWAGREPRSAQADAKQRLTIGAADLDTVVVVVALDRERGEEQLTMRVGMLARGVIVGKLHANFIADALQSAARLSSACRRA